MGATGKRAVVTGAASGIGQAVARRLLREGVAVIAVDMNEAGLAPVVAAGATAVRRRPDRSERTATGWSAEGDGADYLVNAAGIIRAQAHPRVHRR